jgi:hypothetical protein
MELMIPKLLEIVGIDLLTTWGYKLKNKIMWLIYVVYFM